MTPNTFLQFWKSRSGRLLLFGLTFGGGLLVFGVMRERSGGDEPDMLLTVRTNRTDQVVQTVERPMEVFRTPLSKPEPVAVQPRTNAIATTAGGPVKPEGPPPMAPISLFADTAAGLPEPKAVPSVYAPFGRLIPCETVITVDSASIQTPIVGLITEDVYHAGKLVIPAGTELHVTAQTDRHRERIASGSSWTLVWQTGEELHLKGIVLDREFSGDQEGWGITDGSSGLRGRIIKSDDLAEVKLFAATLLSGAASALTEQQPTIFGTLDSRSLNNAPLKGAQDVLEIYAKRILDAIERDGFYVRVPSGKQFYLYVLQTIDRSAAEIGGSETPFDQTPAANAFPAEHGSHPSDLAAAPILPGLNSKTSQKP